MTEVWKAKYQNIQQKIQQTNSRVASKQTLKRQPELDGNSDMFWFDEN
jgi:putative cell wall-binding protein